MTSPAGICHLLRIPTEIRAHIYRYLLLQHTKCYLRHLKNSEDLNSNPTSSPQLFAGSEFSSDSNIESDDVEPGKEDGNKSEYSAFRLEPRNLQILRTNRQIYSEAVGLFYSELQMIVPPGDMMCVTSENEIATPSRKVWKHDPFHGTGTKQENGEYIYNTPELDGFLEPHIFARFQQIELDLDLDFEGLLADMDDDTFPKLTFHIDKNFDVRAADIDAMTAMLHDTNLINNFAQVLSHSWHIRSLQVMLCIMVAVDFPDKKDVWEPYDPTKEEEEIRVEELFEGVAARKAEEVFLESRILDPFRQLSNIRTFNVQVEDTERGFGLATPFGRAGELARELKEAVERGYRVS